MPLDDGACSGCEGSRAAVGGTAPPGIGPPKGARVVARGMQLVRTLTAACFIAAPVAFVIHIAPWRASAAGATATVADAAPNAPRATPSRIRQIWLSDCATCHGANGRGTDLGPDLSASGAALISYYLSTGRMPLGSPNEAPRRGPPKYTPEVQRQLTDFVVALTDNTGPPIPEVHPLEGNLPDGGTLYRANCAACHAWSGDGGALLHRAAPPTHPATPTQIAEAVRGGPGNMPRFGTAALTDQQLQSVVRYVRYLRDPTDRGGNPLGHIGPLVEGAVAFVFGLGA